MGTKSYYYGYVFILTWWKSHESTYHVLSIMTCDLLTPHASIVASKSSFSTAGRVLTDMRNHMSSEVIEMSICVKDWLDVEMRSQNKLVEEIFRR